MALKQVVAVLAAVVGLGLIVFGFLTFNRTTPAVTQTTEDRSPLLGGTATSTNSYEYKENAPYYTIEATYPRKTLLADASADEQARLTIEQALLSTIQQFKQDGDFANLTAEDIEIQGLGEDRKYALGFEYKEYQGSGYVSYVFLVYQDTLGAHPNSYYMTFTFDQAGKRVELSDLFKAGSTYLQTLSPLAYAGVLAELRKKVEVDPQSEMLDTVRIGTAPTPETLQFFYVSGDTLHLLFPPYQVAAYAAGSFDVAIPMSKLTDILK